MLLFQSRFLLIFKNLFTFRERGRKGEREGEKQQSVRDTWIGCLTLTPNWRPNPGTCPDWELNQRPFGLQARTQFTEPHQPRHDQQPHIQLLRMISHNLFSEL